jgi:hypothetical protein
LKFSEISLAIRKSFGVKQTPSSRPCSI